MEPEDNRVGRRTVHECRVAWIQKKRIGLTFKKIAGAVAEAPPS
jgi:hypothetical protein